MAFYENIFATNAARNLLEQLRDITLSEYTQTRDKKYNDILAGLDTYNPDTFLKDLISGEIKGIRLYQFKEGKKAGKLTLEQLTSEGKWEVNSNITPVDCYNLIKPGESLPQAVERLYLSTPYAVK